MIWIEILAVTLLATLAGITAGRLLNHAAESLPALLLAWAVTLTVLLTANFLLLRIMGRL